MISLSGMIIAGLTILLVAVIVLLKSVLLNESFT